MADVLTLKVTYCDCENKIWRTLQITSCSSLSKLASAILATFNAGAYHLYMFIHDEIEYDLPDEEEPCGPENSVFTIKLSHLGLYVGDKLEMVYDFGCDHRFEIQVMDISPLAKGAGRKYPKVIAGAGKGIIEDICTEEILEIIHSIDEGRKPELGCEEMYDGEWDYRDYDPVEDDKTLRSITLSIAEGYAEFMQ